MSTMRQLMHEGLVNASNHGGASKSEFEKSAEAEMGARKGQKFVKKAGCGRRISVFFGGRQGDFWRSSHAEPNAFWIVEIR